MKKVLTAVVGLVAVCTAMLADVETVVNTTVTYNVAKVKVPQVMVMRDRNGLVVTAPYQWLDATNKVLRSGVYRATQAQLGVLGTNAPVVVGVLDKLTPTNGIQPMLMFNLGNVVTAMSRTITGEGTNRVSSVTRYGTNELPAAIAPLTVEQFKGLVQQITTQVLTE